VFKGLISFVTYAVYVTLQILVHQSTTFQAIDCTAVTDTVLGVG